MALPGIFEKTLFTRRVRLPHSNFIKAMHPKAAIRPDRTAIQRILDVGWIAQMKINGHRAQLHLPADASQEIIAYTRQGNLHSRPLPPPLLYELRRVFAPTQSWSALDAEWCKSLNKIFVFDILKFNGQILTSHTYEQRRDLLPRIYNSPFIVTLPIIKSVEQCMVVLHDSDPNIEGLVLKAYQTPGFADRTIIRCRKSIL